MKGRAAAVAAVALLWAPFALGALLVFPMWDDGWLWMLIDEQGPGAIPGAFSDRPLNGWFWRSQAPTAEVFEATQLAWHALLWPVTGWMAARLYRELFPQRPGPAALAACLVVAPLFTTVQMIAANVATASLLPVTLGYGAVLAGLHHVRHGGAASLASLAVLGALGVLYQEYALPVLAVAAVLASRELWPGNDAVRRRRALAVVATAVATAGVAYALFLRLAIRWRADVQPGHALRSRLAELPLELAAALARGARAALGSPPARIADAPALAWIVGLALGAVVAALLLRARSEGGERIPLRTALPGPPASLVLLAAVVVGLLPVVLMGRSPWDAGDGMSSRFALPVLPLLAVGGARLVAALPGRASTAALVALALVMGASTVADVSSELAERRRMARLGAALAERLEGQPVVLTAAVVPVEERPAGPPRQWELAARLAWSWPAERRHAFWAHRSGGGPPLPYPEEATVVYGPRDACRSPRGLDVDVRKLVRRGLVEWLIWLEETEDGEIVVEPYCRDAGAAVSADGS